ncbi:MAG: FAD-dependent oxidoreductase [Devosia sp.]
MSEQPARLQADAAHGFGGIGIDRSKPLSFRLNGQIVHGFAGDTVLTAALASGIVAAGTDGGAALGLDERFCPPIAIKGSSSGVALAMERTPAVDGMDFRTIGTIEPESFLERLLRRRASSLRQRFDGAPLVHPWTREAPGETLSADIVIVGGGVAGLAAAEAASRTGRKIVLIERRLWLGGDARYFGPIGNDETPEAIVERLAQSLAAAPNVTLLTATEAFEISRGAVLAHRVELVDGRPKARIIAVNAANIVLATGALQRLPLFGGNRLPGVVTAIAAYHRAKRFGVWSGAHALFATQSNFVYRLALRIHDAGIAIGRIADLRLNPQSRFVDFSKASGFTMSSGLAPIAAARGAHGEMTLTIRGSGGAAQSLTIPSGQIVVSGSWQPDLTLWMRAGGAIGWNGESGLLEAKGGLDHVVLAGSAAGLQTTKGAMGSGRAAVARLLEQPPVEIDDGRIDAMFETPDDATPIAPESHGRAYLDSGLSLVARHEPIEGAPPWSPVDDARPLSLGDVAASVQARLIAPADAGVIAEERGMAGATIAPSNWVPEAPPIAPSGPSAYPAYLAGRFGPDASLAIVSVDGQTALETGALIYSNARSEVPPAALGVIVGPPSDGSKGGTALLSGAALAKADRFIIETATGPAPLRIIKTIGADAVSPAA